VLVPPSATAEDLERRFADAGAEVLPATTELLLDELAELGLIRASRRDGDVHRYVTTSLGQRAIEAGVQGEAAIPLAVLERLRTELLSTMAHELRTPLTSVRTSVGLLREPSAHPTEEQREMLLGSIERNADRMQRLIGDILELSRFRSGSVALQLRSFSAVGLAVAAENAARTSISPRTSSRFTPSTAIAAASNRH
jgi:signal transduction histidine kinase